jgi:hypothetical protein
MLITEISEIMNMGDVRREEEEEEEEEEADFVSDPNVIHSYTHFSQTKY